VLAEDLVPRAERLFAVKAILARPVTHPWIQNDVIADRDILHLGPDRVDHPAGVGAQDKGWNELDARQSADDEKVEMVDRGGADANANVGRAAKLGNGQVVAELDLIDSAVF
jgi:hypothetical protein